MLDSSPVTNGQVIDLRTLTLGQHTLTVMAVDKAGNRTSTAVTFTTLNTPPVLGPITAPVGPVQVNTLITASANLTDDVGDTHTGKWEWGDNTTSKAEIVFDKGMGVVSGNHTYVQAGVYEVKLTVTDSANASAKSEFQYVVVYDPSAGFVTGGGWVNSPEGAYTADPKLTGKAIFGFVSKYQKGADVPTGQTEFQFKVASLNFHSSSYDWLVIAHHKAMYKGVGTINGAGNYGFILIAIDAKLTPSTDVDMFRIKIWDKDNGDAVVYDNQLGDADDADPTTAIAGGSIVIHAK